MALRSSIARELVFDTMKDAVLVVDGGGRIVDHNRAGAAVLAAAEKADVGSVGHIHRYPALAPVVLGPISDGEGPEIEVGERTFGSSMIPLVGEGGDSVGRAIVLRDVTRRIEAERLLRTLATTDELTRVANRRQFLDLARRAAAQARRSGRPLAWLAVDVDAFARVNERHGRAIGDLVLQSVAAIASASVRAGDVLGRTGGDEFSLCLPDTTAAGARTVAERLRGLVANLRVAAPDGDAQVTVSVGVLVPERQDVDVERSMARAEEAREAATRTGGDRVAFAQARADE